MRLPRAISHSPFFLLAAALALSASAQDGRAVTDANKTTVPTTVIDGKPGEYPAFESIEIARGIEVGYAITTGDVNGDGKLDVVVADTNNLWWFENPNWYMRALTAPRATKPHNVSIAAADLDGDGKVDFAVGADWRPFDTKSGGDVVWVVRGADPYLPWTVVPVSHEPTVHRVAAADLDGDGRQELINIPLMGRDSLKEKNWMDVPVRALAYQPGADPRKDPWKEVVLDHSLHVSHNFDLVNWTGGKGKDILIASYDGVHLFSRGGDGAWTKRRIGEGNQVGAPNSLTKPNPSLGAGEIRLGKLPGGKRMIATVEPWHGHQCVAYIETDLEGLWPRHVIDDAGLWGHSIHCADLRHAGHDDIIVGWRDPATDRKKPGVVAYEPLDAEGTKWRKHVLEEGVAAEAVTVADLNGDGKLDLAIAGRGTHNVKLLIQK